MKNLIDRSQDENDNLRDAFYTDFNRVLDEVASTFYVRSSNYDKKSYPLDHFPFGPVGFLQVMWMKMVRLLGLSQQETISGEERDNLEDCLLDLINYAIFFLIWVRRNVAGPSDDGSK